ncbi:hypothetical protein CsSME_00007170 [Camellia sinensis var. sinensis]
MENQKSKVIIHAAGKEALKMKESRKNLKNRQSKMISIKMKTESNLYYIYIYIYKPYEFYKDWFGKWISFFLHVTASNLATQKTASCSAVVCRIDPPTIKSDHLRKKQAIREREGASHTASRLCAHYLCYPSLDRWQCSPLTTSRRCPFPHAIGPGGSLNRSTTTGLALVESCHHKQHTRAVSRRPIPWGRNESLILMAELLLVGPSWLIGRETYRPPPVLPSFLVIRTRSDLRSCLVGQPLRSCKTGRRAAS